jgi:uncharacterized membrane protein
MFPDYKQWVNISSCIYRRLQDDLTSALKDCKISQKKLVLAQKEVEDLKQRLQNYVSEVQRVEEVLAQKVIAIILIFLLFLMRLIPHRNRKETGFWTNITV